jgi:hypothetical protein
MKQYGLECNEAVSVMVTIIFTEHTKPHARVKLCRGTTTRQISSSAKGTFAPEDGQVLVTETCRVTRDTNILMF